MFEYSQELTGLLAVSVITYALYKVLSIKSTSDEKN